MTAEPRPTGASDADCLVVDTLRTLAMDAVEAAQSGHPGTVMALAPAAYTLWSRFLRFDPEDPIWPNRDRFVLSVGHASMLLYGLLYLSGVRAVNAKYERLGEPAVTLDDIRSFRQLESKCPGHPEYRWTTGVETTTGPLGQGVAVSVGMAIASRWMAERFDRPGFELFGYDVYAFAGDGCLMEGVSGEAASLAGHLGLSNLCWLYDSNRTTIEGHTDWAFSEDVATRFLGYGWNVLRVDDANDFEKLERAFRTFRATPDRPTLVVVESHIGYGAPRKQDTASAHGEPLGEEELRAAKRAFGWPEDARFHVPEGASEHLRAQLDARGGAERRRWWERFAAYRREHPELADALERMQRRRLPEGWDHGLPVFDADPKGLPGRKASGEALNVLARNVPWLVSGSADLAPSTKTRLELEGAGDLTREQRGGRNLHYGVREHAMGAVLNGLAHCKVRPVGSTFLIFSDYARPSLRLAALMEIPVVYVFTHDSIGVGEDGPTHQPVEQLASLRAVPGLVVLRPADANEVVEAWRAVMALHHTPAALVLSRQVTPTCDRERYASAEGLHRGGYVLADPAEGAPEAILIGTGTEVALCLEAHEQLAAEGLRTRVVSLPSWELFAQQPEGYRSEVLPPELTARVAVEQASTFGWERYVGPKGRVVGMETFGASAPLQELQRRFGFTPDRVAEAVREQIGAR